MNEAEKIANEKGFFIGNDVFNKNQLYRGKIIGFKFAKLKPYIICITDQDEFWLDRLVKCEKK